MINLWGWLEIRTRLKGKSVGSWVLIGVGRVALRDILPNAWRPTELPGQVFRSEEIPRPYAHFLISPLKRYPGLTLQVSQSHDGDWALFSATWTHSVAAGKKILLQPTHRSLQNVYLHLELGTIYVLCAWCFPFMLVCAPCACSTSTGQEGVLDFLGLEWQMLATMWVLRIQLGSSWKSARALNYWIISSARTSCFLARGSLICFVMTSRDARSNEPASLSSLLFHTCSKILCTEEPSNTLLLTREEPGSSNECVLHSSSNSAHPPCSLCYPRSLQSMQICWVGETAPYLTETTGEIHPYNRVSRTTPSALISGSQGSLEEWNRTESINVLEVPWLLWEDPP